MSTLAGFSPSVLTINAQAQWKFYLMACYFRQCSQEQIAPKNREQLYYILFGFKTIDQFSLKNDTFTLK